MKNFFHSDLWGWISPAFVLPMFMIGAGLVALPAILVVVGVEKLGAILR